jgi:hypothetical protein
MTKNSFEQFRVENLVLKPEQKTAVTAKRPVSADDVKDFLKRMQGMVNAHYGTHYPLLALPNFQAKAGKKYVKITTNNGGSVFAFIDAETGDILKPANFKAPAKHARGNIFDQSGGLDAITPYGVKYLK